MRVRALTSNGDYQVGTKAVFLSNSPQAVLQAINTRLKLSKGDWFLDTSEGLDLSKILGVRTQSTRDLEVQSRILGTPGVSEITNYQSAVNGRAFTVTATVQTLYGAAQFTGTF